MLGDGCSRSAFQCSNTTLPMKYAAVIPSSVPGQHGCGWTLFDSKCSVKCSENKQRTADLHRQAVPTYYKNMKKKLVLVNVNKFTVFDTEFLVFKIAFNAMTLNLVAFLVICFFHNIGERVNT